MWYRLDELFDLQMGKTPSRSNGKYWNCGDNKWISIRDLTPSQKYVSETKESISNDAVIESGIKVVPANTVVMSFKLSIGKVAITKECMYSNEAVMAFLDKHMTELLPEYIYYLFRYRDWGEGINKAVMGKTLNKATLSKIKIDICPIQKQKDIVKLLDKVSYILTNRKNQILTLENLIKSRFVEMFGDPVHNSMEWPIKKLSDLSLQINSGNTPKGGEQVYVDKGITFFRSQNVWKDRLEMDDIAYIGEITHASMNRSSLKHGDILMTKTGRINTENSSLGRAALYLGEDDAANVNGHVYFIRLRAGVNNKFILRILVSDEYRDYIRSVCVGGIDKRQLNKDHIENFPIICPPESMIEEYIMFVEQIDKLKFPKLFW
ncbi:MAG: restriction endonuclease subunit S [Lachnospiraceae bacterium]|nr:restriction endonuclease subunit S [Lachnospiraceae bacterium]